GVLARRGFDLVWLVCFTPTILPGADLRFLPPVGHNPDTIASCAVAYSRSRSVLPSERRSHRGVVPPTLGSVMRRTDLRGRLARGEAPDYRALVPRALVDVESAVATVAPICADVRERGV